jgi:signal transduction histidine kinase
MNKRYHLWLLFGVVAAAIFFLDTVTNADISVLYVTLVLIVRGTGTVRDILIAGLACFGLTIGSYGITPGFSLAKLDEPLVNVVISLFAIASVTYLSIKVAISETGLQKARDQLARTMLGVSISELATTVVHEITQPLGVVGANVAAAKHWLEMTPTQIPEAQAAIDAAVRNAHRMEGVISGLRRLASVSLSDRQTFDAIELINETVETVRQEINGRRVVIRIHFSQPVISVDGDRALLQQVILNLLLNAVEAMDHAEIGNRVLSVEANLVGDLVSVSVRDTGPGISPECLDNIFEPFYTTKPKGLGIGLAISRSVVLAHGGSLKASHNSPRGAVITVTLPTPKGVPVDDGIKADRLCGGR